jgi:diaminopimelate decarboxylase
MPTPVDTPLRLDFPTAERLATQYGTPLYVLSEPLFRQTIRRYKAAFQAAYPKTELSYASKANGSLALLAIAHDEDCLIDVASEGELRGALAAGVPAARCVFHGNNKDVLEIAFALECKIGTIVADNLPEIDHLTSIWRPCSTKVMLRLAPGVDPITHEKIATGQEDSKFGLNISDGAAEEGLRRALAGSLPVAGFHCHVGSQLLNPEAQIAGGEGLAKFAVSMKSRLGYTAEFINLGGGLGIACTEHDRPLDVETYCEKLVARVKRILDEGGLQPILGQEPGRALVGECGLTLYTVGAIKEVPVTGGRRRYVSVDGGLSDNPRPALYGAEYRVESMRPSAEMARATVCGKHCESDELFPNVPLPADIAAGDLLQVPCTGAYNSSMSSNYNRFPRPATVLLRMQGEPALVQRRESWAEMFARENLPDGLRR